MAGALANYFERVDVFERDRLTTSVGLPSGSPLAVTPFSALVSSIQLPIVL